MGKCRFVKRWLKSSRILIEQRLQFREYIYILFFFPIAEKNGNFPWLVLIFGYLLFRIAQYFNDRFLVVEN